MQTTTQRTPADETIVTPLCGVMLYEDRDAHARALNLYAYLAVAIARVIPLHFSWWAFPEANNKIQAAAIRNAIAGADLVIIAAKPARDWSPEFKLWIESWALPKHKRLSALGALLSPVQLESSAICGRQTYLEYVAANLGLDFLSADPDETAQMMKRKLAPVPVEDEYEDDLMDRPDFSPFCGVNG